MAELALIVEERAWSGWTGMHVARSIDALAGSFELSVSERDPARPERRPISVGNRCRLTVDGETLITGFVDEIEAAYDATSHSVTIRGRDAAGDLVDCSAINEPGEWSGLKLERIVAEIAKPFGIPVVAVVDTGDKFGKFSIQPGESCFEAIDRACRMRAVLALSDGVGGLVLTRAGDSHTSVQLKRGVNILAARALYSSRERYSEYIFKGQSGGTDGWGGADAAEPLARARDLATRGPRPLVVLAEAPAEGLSYDDRATWEASVRAGRAREIAATVAGWRHAGAPGVGAGGQARTGGLWQPNRLVGISDRWLAVDRDMLIASVSFDHTAESGTTTTLGLIHPDAFSLLPAPEVEEIGW